MTESPTVGLLYPGEMGASLGKLLRAAGLRVVTTLAGRSDRTLERSRETGIEVLPSLNDLANQASWVFSLVETSAAAQVARSYVQSAPNAARGSIYIDVNSIGPETAQVIGQIICTAGCDFVDASINGPAKTLATGGTLFLSGPRANEVGALLGSILRVRVLGTEIGRASAMKMLLGGLAKGLCGLFLELAVMAEQRGILPEMMDACTMIYPGITTVIDRMLPTYAVHAGRRSAEMRELEQTVQNSGMEPCVVAAVRQLHDGLAALPLEPSDGASIASLVQRTMGSFLLAVAPDPNVHDVA